MISQEGRVLGLDIFGTEQISTMALEFTKAYFMNELNKNINALFAADGEIRGEC